jgi:hypothetical protein
VKLGAEAWAGGPFGSEYIACHLVTLCSINTCSKPHGRQMRAQMQSGLRPWAILYVEFPHHPTMVGHGIEAKRGDRLRKRSILHVKNCATCPPVPMIWLNLAGLGLPDWRPLLFIVHLDPGMSIGILSSALPGPGPSMAPT